jgi:glutaminyl-peptide cyclotransferase
MIIAIDFDGTIVEHKYPEIGKEMLFAFETLKELQKQKHQLILWTYRSGKELDEAVEYCRERGIEFYAVNKNYPEEEFDDTMSRKIHADIYIDDRNIGGFPGWSEVWQRVNAPESGIKDEIKQIRMMSRKRGRWLSGLFRTKLFQLLLILASSCIIVSCAGNKDQASVKKSTIKKNLSSSQSFTRITSPADKQQFSIGQEIALELESLSDTLYPDSAGIYLNGKLFQVLYSPPFHSSISSSSMTVGDLSIRIIAWHSAGNRDIHNLTAILLSDIQPESIPYRIENTYPHDTKAYTQGLVYHDGFLFEGTGQLNNSTLRKVFIRTGEAIRMMNLPADVFGEGITLFNDKIFQLTYRSQVGFVYDLESFKRLQKVYYQNKEGWGLTNDGEHLIMSDGSHRIYYMDPEYFTELKQVEVFDNKGPVTRLNELEYIRGKILANIYGEEIIAVIDPSSGKVTGQLNMKGILAAEDRTPGMDVFNGIAWDPDNELLYVTGKNWPLLFEIRITGDF